jgi:hypothetical protein
LDCDIAKLRMSQRVNEKERTQAAEIQTKRFGSTRKYIDYKRLFEEEIREKNPPPISEVQISFKVVRYR